MTAIPVTLVAMDGTKVEPESAVLELSGGEDGGVEMYVRSAKGRKVSVSVRLDLTSALDLLYALPGAMNAARS